LIRLHLSTDLLQIEKFTNLRMDEDVMTPAHSPQLEAERLDQPPHVPKGDIGDVAAREPHEESSRIHGGTLPPLADETGSSSRALNEDIARDTGLGLGVDGGNSKTDVVVAALDGELVGQVRGPGNNSHSVGPEATVAFLRGLVEPLLAEAPASHGVFYLCGVDIPSDRTTLATALEREPWVERATVDNDVFALLRAGADDPDAVAVVCGAGINCAGRSSAGGVARYPSLGWETGDWGGSVMLGREVLFHAARAEDGRGEPTALPEVVAGHFGLSVPEVGEAVRYGRIPATRLGELAPAVVAAAEAGDPVAHRLVDRLAEEVVLMAMRALADLGLVSATILLGGGMLRGGAGFLYDEVVERLAERAPRAKPLAVTAPPVLGAALDALDAAGAPPAAIARLRAAV
jgi:N-acetylglucosamine kinase-like BadF-type ATPase